MGGFYLFSKFLLSCIDNGYNKYQELGQARSGDTADINNENNTWERKLYNCD